MKKYVVVPNDFPVISVEPETLGDLRAAAGGGGGGPGYKAKDALVHNLAAHEHSPQLGSKSCELLQLEWMWCAEYLAALDFLQRDGDYVDPDAWRFDNYRKFTKTFAKATAAAAERLVYDGVPSTGGEAPVPALAQAHSTRGIPSASWAYLAQTNYPHRPDGPYGDEYFFSPTVAVDPSVGLPGQVQAFNDRLQRLLVPPAPVDPQMLEGNEPSVEVAVIDHLENIDGRGRVMVYDQDEEMKNREVLDDGTVSAEVATMRLCMSAQYHQAENNGDAMPEMPNYRDFEDWRAQHLTEHPLPTGIKDVAGRLIDRLGNVGAMGSSSTVPRTTGDPRDFPNDQEPCAARTVVALRDQHPFDELPQYYIDQDMSAPLMMDHLHPLRLYWEGLYIWREEFMGALGAMIGQRALAHSLDQMAEVQMIVRGQAGTPMPLVLRSMSGSMAAVGPHMYFVAQQGMQLQAQGRHDMLDPWLQAVYDHQTLCWNTPICVQEMRLYLLWALQCKMDALRFGAFLRQVERSTPGEHSTNLDKAYRALVTGCCTALAPLSRWMLPAVYLFFCRAMPDADGFWGANTGDQLVSELPRLLEAYLREKWVQLKTGGTGGTARYQRVLDGLSVSVPAAGPAGSRGNTKKLPARDNLLLAFLVKGREPEFETYLGAHGPSIIPVTGAVAPGGAPNTSLRNPFWDVLAAIEQTVETCMRGFMAASGTTADQDLFPEDKFEGTERKPLPLPELLEERGKREGGEPPLYAVDAVAVWCRTGLLPGIASAALAFESGGGGIAPMYKTWTDRGLPVRANRTREGEVAFSALTQLASIRSEMQPASALPFAMRHSLPGLVAAIGASKLAWPVLPPRYYYQDPAPGTLLPATDLFEEADWGTESEEPDGSSLITPMYVTSPEVLDTRTRYVHRQVALETSRNDCALSRQWLRGVGGQRRWDCSQGSLALAVTCIYPVGAHQLRVEWFAQSLANGLRPHGHGDFERRLLKSETFAFPPGADKETRTEQLRWERSGVYVSPAYGADAQSVASNQRVFATYATMDPVVNRADFSLNVEVVAQALDFAGTVVAESTQVVCIGGSREHYEDAFSVAAEMLTGGLKPVPGTALLFFEAF